MGHFILTRYSIGREVNLRKEEIDQINIIYQSIQNEHNKFIEFAREIRNNYNFNNTT